MQQDPLAQIPAQPMNSSNINVSFMPPPPSLYNYYDAATPLASGPSQQHHQHHQPLDGDDAAGEEEEGQEEEEEEEGNDEEEGGGPALPDWIALPLDQFFNSSTTAVVDQGLGGTGPMVGELDMLEILLNEQYDGCNPATTTTY